MKINTESAHALNSKTQGQVLLPGNREYNEARMIWNGMFDKKPGLISRCETTQDVVEWLRVVDGDLVEL